MRQYPWINRKVVFTLIAFGAVAGTVLSPVWSSAFGQADTAALVVAPQTDTSPPMSSRPTGQAGSWNSLLSSAGSALYWGTEATVSTGQQAAIGAYYLGGELVESGRIVGVHALRAMGLLGQSGSIQSNPAREDSLVRQWGETGTAFEEPVAVSRDRVSTPTVSAMPVQASNGLLKKVSLKPDTRPALAAKPTPPAMPDDDMTAQCEWPALDAPAMASFDSEGIRTLTDLGLMSEGARRMADGRVFFPKVSQRLLQIRTGYSCDGPVASSQRLVGHVIANPISSGLVQAEQDGRIEAGEFGFPTLGQRIQRGELLGYLVPTLSSRDRAELEAEIEILRGDIAKLELELARTREMPLLPFRDGRILSLRLELNKLRAQRDALVTGLEGRQPLIASASGVVARADVRVGQVVEARDLLWEIVDTTDLWIEAEWFGGEPLADAVNASAVTSSGQVVSLDYQGAGWSLGGGQSAPLQFRTRAEADGLRIGEQVVVHLRKIDKEQGTLIPKSALIRRSNGEMSVWHSTAPEWFEPVRVSWKPVDGNLVLVEAGLPKHARVVLAGAALLSEVR